MENVSYDTRVAICREALAGCEPIRRSALMAVLRETHGTHVVQQAAIEVQWAEMPTSQRRDAIRNRMETGRTD